MSLSSPGPWGRKEGPEPRSSSGCQGNQEKDRTVLVSLLIPCRRSLCSSWLSVTCRHSIVDVWVGSVLYTLPRPVSMETWRGCRGFPPEHRGGNCRDSTQPSQSNSHSTKKNLSLKPYWWNVPCDISVTWPSPDQSRVEVVFNHSLLVTCGSQICFQCILRDMTVFLLTNQANPCIPGAE